MGLLFFGTREVPIGVDEEIIFCPSCEGYSMADVMVLSSYFHVYYLPLFPVAKEVNTCCQQCGLKNSGLPLNSQTIKNYKELKHKFRHPWYTYLFLAFVILLILSAIIF